ncbi:MAG: electron transfer flavoprotein subunit alpha/FixB family protein [Cyanobacteria bacterium NC_groundwater_1444_Ag_S-0.65um_54_12]|nr:electron transfer flavoprotein subunit alpha/FixB family protein [Cyanobacteria bacterium NC_groundwater_1444_Ag_S-0.65um_54_12]
MSGVWTVAEVSDGGIKGISFELLGAARSLANNLAEPVGTVLIGHEVANLADELFAHGADRVLVAEHPALASFAPERHARVIGDFATAYAPQVLLIGHTGSGKEIAGRLAARLDVSVITDCVALQLVDAQVRCTRPIFGGSMLTTAVATKGITFATIRPKAFARPAPAIGRPGEVLQLAVSAACLVARTEVVEVVNETSTAISLTDAEIVCAGGRGVGSAEKFELIERLAKELGAAVGASRAVVDAGWRPHKEQVGQTGKTVSPKLYIAAGISGAIQHLVGMRSSDTIVAINTDPEAPIMKVANLAVTADLLEVIPKVIEELKILKGAAV